MTINVPGTIIRRSENTNAFGLRGYVFLESVPAGGRSRCRAFEFGANYLSDFRPGQDVELPFHTDCEGVARYPAFELTSVRGECTPEDRKAIIAALFG